MAGLDTALTELSRNFYWYRHTGYTDGTQRWDARQSVAPGTFADYRLMAVSPQGVVYAVTPGGDLYWFIHDGMEDGSARWRGPTLVQAGGWERYRSITASSEGALYGVTPDGDLYYFSHTGWKDGSPSSKGPIRLGHGGWADYSCVFAAADGVIYGVNAQGVLLWYLHEGYEDGTTTMWNGGKAQVVGTGGWDQYVSVFAGENGTIYSVTPTGDLAWHRHDGWLKGTQEWAAPEGGAVVGVGGWLVYRSVFAAGGGVVYGLGVDTASWMSVIPPGRRVTQFTIPGSHDTGTWNTDKPHSKCQAISLKEQLQAGIRFIDVRVKQDDNNGSPDFGIYHGKGNTEWMHLWFSSDIVATCKQFLSDHPSETIIMCVKDEWGSTVDFESHLELYLTDSLCLKAQDAPSMARARGRIVLFNRCDFGTLGILAGTGWPNDGTGDVNTGSNVLKVQDVYSFGGVTDLGAKVDTKWSLVEQHLNGAKGDTDAGNWWINFSSASGDPAVLDPVHIAQGWSGQDGVNKKLQSYLGTNNKGNFGTVMMDFPEFPDSGDVVKRLIRTNLQVV